jgi:SAM-dependent methyltransferase
MWSDVVDFNRFYRSRLGQATAALVRTEIQAHWPVLPGSIVVGLGYATPYLDLWEQEASRVLALMPAHQGVTHWPAAAPNRVALADEAALPLDDLSVDRLLLVHAVENSEHLRAMMRECFRVLSGHGRLLAVVPSRRGIWARTERTPFGHGKPFTRSQMERLLRDSQFEAVSVTRALYMPPVEREFVLKAGGAVERFGKRFCERLGGALFVEAHKQVYAATPARRVAVSRRFAPAPQLEPALGAGFVACQSDSTDAASDSPRARISGASAVGDVSSIT